MGWEPTQDGGFWRFESDSDGFSFLVTNLVDVWADTLKRSDIVVRGQEIGCIVDLYDGFEPFCGQIVTLLRECHLKCSSERVMLSENTPLGTVRWEFRPQIMPRIFAINLIRGMIFDAIKMAECLRSELSDTRRALSEREFHIRNMDEAIVACAPSYEPQAFLDAYESSLHRPSEYHCMESIQWPPLQAVEAEVLPYPYSAVKQNSYKLYGTKSPSRGANNDPPEERIPSPVEKSMKIEDSELIGRYAPQDAYNRPSQGSGTTTDGEVENVNEESFAKEKTPQSNPPNEEHKSQLDTIIKAPKRSKWS